MQRCLIVGLGNPGKQYAKTRHNVGHMVLQAIADEYSLSFKNEGRINAEIAKGTAEETMIWLAFPTTYMNLSGSAVLQCMRYYKLSPQEILVIADDVDLPLGALRLKPQGGPGGHKGLQSLNLALKSQEYPRLRVGVGDRAHGSLESHVLGCFTEGEKERLEEVILRAKQAIKLYLREGIESAMTFANTSSKTIRNQIKEEQ